MHSEKYIRTICCVLQEQLRDTALLVIANKQDISGAMKAAELTSELDLLSLRNRPWCAWGLQGVPYCHDYPTTGSGVPMQLEAPFVCVSVAYFHSFVRRDVGILTPPHLLWEYDALIGDYLLYYSALIKILACQRTFENTVHSGVAGAVLLTDGGPMCVRRRYIQSACGTTGEGLYEGLDWLSENMGKIGS